MKSPEQASDRVASQGPRVTSVVTALSILRHLAAHPRGGGVNAIARALSISPSSCFNVLKTLAAERFVDFDPVNKIYSLGPECVAIARPALDPTAAFATAHIDLQRLADQFELTSSIWRLRRAERLVLLGFADTEAATRIHLSVGQRMPILAGAAGRCIAAFENLSVPQLRKQLALVKWATPPDLDAYLGELDQVRARGWAVDRDGYMRGVTSIAAPVFNGEQEISFCVVATLFSGQRDTMDLAEVGEATAAAARRIAARLHGKTEQAARPAKVRRTG